MSGQATHIIQRQRYELEVLSQQAGLQLQQSIQELHLRHIAPALNSKLDDWFGGSEVTVIDRLDINLGRLTTYADGAEWTERLLRDLEQALLELGLDVAPQQLLAEATAAVSETDHAIDVWIHFLKTGSLPTACVYPSTAAVKEVLAQLNTTDRQTLRTRMLAARDIPNVWIRLAALPAAAAFFFLKLFVPELSYEDWDRIDAGLSSSRLSERTTLKDNIEGITSPVGQRQALMEAIWQHVLQSVAKAQTVRAADLTTILERKLQQMEPLTVPADRTTIQTATADDRVPADNIPGSPEQAAPALPFLFVENAGLCLLAPFLPSFFQALALSDGQAFRDSARWQHAVYLLHYLATGEDAPGEEHLACAKLLCGWPLQMPCICLEPIKDEEREEAAQLLTAVIGHWQALKQTSPDGLREGFLKREGKLIQEEDHFVLQVASQSIDLLLDQVPWTFRNIQLPWMKQRLSVEWY